MILAVDIGNTYIVVGCIRDDEIVFVERLHTDTKKSELEYAISIKTVLEIYGIDKKELAGAILSSAVPPLTGVMRRAAGKVTGREPLVVGPGVKTGLDIRIDNPAQLGSDLVVGAVAAIEEYPCPLVVVDLGTATTFTVVNEKKQVMGRHDYAGRGRGPGRHDQPYIPASEDQPGSAEKVHRQQHCGLHEERRPLWKRGLRGRYDWTHRGGTGPAGVCGSHRRYGQVHCALLQAKA